MLDVPEHGEAVADQRQWSGTLDGALGAVLRVLEAELTLCLVEGHFQRPAFGERLDDVLRRQRGVRRDEDVELFPAGALATSPPSGRSDAPSAATARAGAEPPTPTALAQPHALLKRTAPFPMPSIGRHEPRAPYTSEIAPAQMEAAAGTGKGAVATTALRQASKGA